MKLNNECFVFFRKFGIIVCVAFGMFFIMSCSDNKPTAPYQPLGVNTSNPAKFIKDKEKLATIYNIEDIDGKGRLYEVHYTADYKLDEALRANISSAMDLFDFVGQHLYDSIPRMEGNGEISFMPGCSAFAVNDKATGNYLMGRNYDFCHTDTSTGTKKYIPISVFVVHTAPEGGKKSISFVDGLNLGYAQGAYSDGLTDLSTLVGLPYVALDGINEDGFAIGVLSLNEAPTMQNDPTKTNIGTTVAIRMLLDRASTVKDAINMLKKYNMRMKNTDEKHNYHFFMADANGDYAIVEYTRSTNNKAEKYPTRMEVLSGNDTLRCVTNFYVSPTMIGTTDGWGAEHGKTRYLDMRSVLSNNGYAMLPTGAMSLLSLVSQEPVENDPTSFTQWSALYNLTKKSVKLSILREYGKLYDFKVGF